MNLETRIFSTLDEIIHVNYSLSGRLYLRDVKSRINKIIKKKTLINLARSEGKDILKTSIRFLEEIQLCLNGHFCTTYLPEV